MRARLIDVIAVVVLSLASGCAPGPTTADKSATPTLAHDTRHYSTIAAGFVHTCALDQQGTAFCWGNNDYSQLGAETAETCGGRPCSTSPMRVRGDTRFTVLSAGWVHNCGIAADGRAWCWGGGSVEREGYLGDGTLRRSVQPVAVISDSALVAITIGDGHSCALTASGQAYCWGENEAGQVGDGSNVDRALPVPVAGSLRFRALSAGAYHTCGIALTGVAYCWGDNRWGQLGAGEVAYNSVDAARAVPVAVLGEDTWTHVAAGWQHTCAIASTGVTHCWGRNEDAKQLGDDSEVTHRGTPAPITDDPSFATIIAGPLATCGRTTGGDTWCWGGNYYGGLGDGSTVAQGVARPTRVKGGPFIDIALGQAHSCALGSDRELWCWGDKSAGQY